MKGALERVSVHLWSVFSTMSSIKEMCIYTKNKPPPTPEVPFHGCGQAEHQLQIRGFWMLMSDCHLVKEIRFSEKHRDFQLELCVGISWILHLPSGSFSMMYLYFYSLILLKRIKVHANHLRAVPIATMAHTVYPHTHTSPSIHSNQLH